LRWLDVLETWHLIVLSRHYRRLIIERAKMELIMQQVSVKFFPDELQALLEMVDNQLFRMKFIDTKVPGHKPDTERLAAANSAVKTLQDAFKKGKGYTAASVGFGNH
jgi:hypothetical protein